MHSGVTTFQTRSDSKQFLMRTLKTSEGITHGRGITDSTLTKWVHALPRCAPVMHWSSSLEFTLAHQSNTKIYDRVLRQETSRIAPF